MSAIETDDKYYVKESDIENAGLGLYARQRLPVGTRLEVVGALVEKVGAGEVCTRYARDYRFLYDDNTMLIPTGWAGMANHSTRFNSVLVKVEDKLYLEMLRDIHANEEIVYEYSTAAMLRLNMQSKGQAFAVVCHSIQSSIVKMVTANMAKALKKCEALKQELGEGWTVNISPVKLDLQELRGNLN